MKNELFNKVVELDNAMNAAIENGDLELCEELENDQNEVMEEIEALGLRDEFDAFIESMN